MDDNTTYMIVRRYFKECYPSEIVYVGLTLEKAKEHCQDPESSSSTCELSCNVARTYAKGPWFESYTEE